MASMPRASSGFAVRTRVMGSLALSLCHLAAGRVDAVVSLKPARSVDIAAAQLLVRERGLAIDLPEAPPFAAAPLDLAARSRVVAASTPELCAELLRPPRSQVTECYESSQRMRSVAACPCARGCASRPPRAPSSPPPPPFVLHPPLEVGSDGRPFVVGDRVVGRVAQSPFTYQHMLAKMPSKRAGSASRATRERSFRASVLNSTRMQPSVSNACRRSRSFASAFAPLPQALRAFQVQPISSPRRSGPKGQVPRAPYCLPAAPVDDREGNVEAGYRRSGESVVEPAVEALAVGCGVPGEPAPDLGVSGCFPEVVLVLGRQRLDDDEPTFEARRGPLPPRHPRPSRRGCRPASPRRRARRATRLAGTRMRMQPCEAE